MTPEFSRPFVVERIPPEGTSVSVEATPTEAEALAARFGLPRIEALTCRFQLRPATGGAIAATGELRARIAQICVVSTDIFDVAIHETFALNFVRATDASPDLDPESPDDIEIENGRIDLGETAAQQLALGLDPYPRKPGVEADVPGGADHANPFGALATLRTREPI